MSLNKTPKLPWLSVIMPCHNGERWLAVALQSIVEQHDPGIEVIIVDSSESKTCLQISARFNGLFDLRTYRREDMLPWPAKTNFGVEQARAEWICILHQDDLWLSSRSESLKKWLARQPDAVMHLHPVRIIDARGRMLGIWRCPLSAGDAPVPREIITERLLVQNFIAIPAPVIQREAFLRVGGMDAALWYTADWDLYLKLSAVGNVWYHTQPLACFRIHKSSLTISGSSNLEEFRKQHELVRDRHADTYKASGQAAMILRLAAASIDINTAMAAANAGRPRMLFKALRPLLGLGPRGILKYLFYSRIIERLIPRLLARLYGGL